MAFLATVLTDGPHTGTWEISGTEDYTSTCTLFHETFSFPLSAVDVMTSRYVLAELSLLNVVDLGCTARVSWNIVTVPVIPGRPPAAPCKETLQRDGARIHLPANPLLEPIFCVFHRVGDVLLSPRLLVSVQFHVVTGLSNRRKVGVTVTTEPLPAARYVRSEQYVRMQVHAFDPEISDWEEDAETDEGETEEQVGEDTAVEHGVN